MAKNKGKKVEDIDVTDIELDDEEETPKKNKKAKKEKAAPEAPAKGKGAKKEKAKEVDTVMKKGEKSKGAARAEAREGMVTAADLSEEYGIAPRVIRQTLRDAELEKPDHGWAWKKNDPQLKEVRALLKGKGTGGKKVKEEAPAETPSKGKGKKGKK